MALGPDYDRSPSTARMSDFDSGTSVGTWKWEKRGPNGLPGVLTRLPLTRTQEKGTWSCEPHTLLLKRFSRRCDSGRISQLSGYNSGVQMIPIALK